MNEQPAIEVRHLSHRYGARLALDRVSLTLQRGGFNALLGPNGAGKSTLFALLTRLYRIQQGDILFEGVPVDEAPRHYLGHLGVVFQQSTLDLDLTVQQNLEYHGALHGLSSRQIRARAACELEWLGLAERRHDRVRALNGGHRRRVEIARALLHQPSVLLLDEASAGLDIASRQTINRAVRSLCNERGLTVLWATHLLEEVAPDDPLIILHRGRVCARGSGAAICREQGIDSVTELFERLTGAPAA